MLQKIYSSLLGVVFMAALFVSIAPSVSAIGAGQLPGCSGTQCFSAPPENLIPDPLRETDIRVQVIKIINYFLSFLGLICVIMIIYAGFLLIFSLGSDETISKAKTIITYVAIGIIVILLSYVIVNFLIAAGTATP